MQAAPPWDNLNAMDIIVTPDGTGLFHLQCGETIMRCAVGRGGLGLKLREGDGITPAGTWPLREVLFRPDRIERPMTALPLRAISPNDGWCEEPKDPHYNRHVTLPHPAAAESMWREDHLYDVVCVIGYNDAPVVPGKGSAIFLHLSRPDYTPTQGCVGLPREQIIRVLKDLTPESRIRIGY
jgi:L,D-peptidoglycan transpeptidase YkuD (ErfK/YbiS/YcfS/YnhG family)